MMAKVMPQLMVMALVLHRALTMINKPCERMLKLCKTVSNIAMMIVVLMSRAKLVRCDKSRCV
jgi:hypothetical protein